MSGTRGASIFPGGMVDRTVHTKAYIPYVLHIPSGHTWMDLGTDYGVYLFLFSQSCITEDGIMDDFLRVIVSGLFPCCASRRPGTTVKA